MILYCPDKGQNIIDNTKFHDNIIMKYCPGGHNFTGHNFALQMKVALKHQKIKSKQYKYKEIGWAVI